MKRPLAGICTCPEPCRASNPDTSRPFACLRCRRVMRIGDLLTVADTVWLRGNRIALGPLEAEIPNLPPPPEMRGGEEAAC